MSQVLSLRLADDQADAALARFVTQWAGMGGTATAAEQGYDLVMKGGGRALLSIEGRVLSLQGDYGDEGVEVMQSLADSLGAELLLEDEVLEEAAPPRWDTLGPLGKAAGVALVALLLPVGLVLLPVLLLVVLIRLLVASAKR